MEWTLLGKADPQREQMFWPVEAAEQKLVRAGDTLAARSSSSIMIVIMTIMMMMMAGARW